MRDTTGRDEDIDQIDRVRELIVDDHEVVHAGLAAALSQDPGLRVVALAASGAEAGELANRERPDVAIIDMRLPDVPGPELCRRLRTTLPAMPVVVLSSYLSEDAVREAMAAGASAYVIKSAGLSELRRRSRKRSGRAPPRRVSHRSSATCGGWCRPGTPTARRRRNRPACSSSSPRA